MRTTDENYYGKVTFLRLIVESGVEIDVAIDQGP
jgi:hypothetical protein